MAFQTLLLLFSLIGCGLCWRRPIDFPDVQNEWPVMPKPGLEVETSVGNPIVCEICEVVVEEMKTFLGNDSKKIIAWLNGVCDWLPSDYNATCREYVDEWTPMIIDFLENETPEEICGDLTLCSEAAVLRSGSSRLTFGHVIRYLHRNFKKSFNKIMIRNALGNDFLCDGCNQVVDYLHGILTNQQLLAKIAGLLSDGCVLCPVEDECRATLEKLPAIVEAWANENLNNQTCKIIGLCTTSRPDDNLFNMFSRLFPGFLPDSFDRDVISGRPWYRPRPNTEPAPRPHPYRGYWDRRDEEHRPDDTSEGPGIGRPDHDHHHDRPYRPNHGPRPEHPHRPDHQDRPHHGPHHGYQPDGDMPRPDVRPWWKPAMKPFRPRPWGPWGGENPALPEEPMTPEVEVPEVDIPEVDIPDVEIPIADEIPNVDIPVEIEIPEVQVPQVPGLEFQPDPRNPFGYKPKPQQGSNPSSRGNPWWKTDLTNRKDAWLGKSVWGTRNRRSFRINTVVNTGDFDKANTFDVEPVKNPVEPSWQCDFCEYEVTEIQTYMEDNKDVFNQELLSFVDVLCDRLPATSTAECKTEFANLLPPIVDMIIDYVDPITVCSALMVC